MKWDTASDLFEAQSLTADVQHSVVVLCAIIQVKTLKTAAEPHRLLIR